MDLFLLMGVGCIRSTSNSVGVVKVPSVAGFVRI